MSGRVVVTGAGRGIGRAIAEELGRGGAKIVVNYSQSKGPSEEVVAKLLENGSPQSVAIQADVADAAQAAKLIEETIKQFGRIDVLINNAGINLDRSMKNMSVEDWNKVIQVDLNAYFYTVKAALPYFMEQKSGAIINISSVIGQMGNFGQANYAAAGLIGNLIGATAAGVLYGYSTGFPFFIAGLIYFGACLVLLLPGIARMFLAARRNVQTEHVDVELIEETAVER